jgi:DNA modification methylase
VEEGGVTVRILQGDCREVLRTLDDESVHCVVTSPPYFGLRDYGCDEQIGLEQTPAEFVEQIVGVMREVRRVLRPDGTLWLNLGDSYANDGKWGGETGGKQAYLDRGSLLRNGREKRVTGLKAKDLIGIPWRVAFALQADGWWLRQDIIWHKPNPMPESVRDRCTKAHEYLFLMAKSERYYYDFDSMQESVTGGAHARKPGNKSHKGTAAYEAGDDKHRTKAGLVAYAERVGRRDGPPGNPAERKLGAVGSGIKNNASFDAAMEVMPDMRNRRSVWTVGTEPFSEAHFATFPPALIEPCVKAGCPEGGTVLDPFGGAGTTGLVADRLQRNAVLIELNPAYVEIAQRRIVGDAPLFAEVAA